MAEYIDKEDVLDEINRMGTNAFADYTEYSALFDYVDRAESADVAPVIHARWEKDNIDSIHCWKCSNCSSQHWSLYNFCPSCGAKMDTRRNRNERISCINGCYIYRYRLCQ